MYAASGALETGDDYPWFSPAIEDEGGTPSPLGYYQRERVDFGVCPLDLDAGTQDAPYPRTWSKPRKSEPEAGAVARFPGADHVACVKAVLPGDMVLLEEHSWGGKHSHRRRTSPAPRVDLFLYAPPA